MTAAKGAMVLTDAEAWELMDYVGAAYFGDFATSEEGARILDLKKDFSSEGEFLGELRSAFEFFLNGSASDEMVTRVVRKSFNRAVHDANSARAYLTRIHQELFS